MHDLSLLDLGFFIAETEASPKHVAGLMIFKRPARSTAFAHKLYRDFLAGSDVKPPFNRVIQFSLSAMPKWCEAQSMDMHQHVFFHQLPATHNDLQALYDLVAKLHEPMLDRSRPLWEVHVIDGVSEGRFALYNKIHHACGDGVTMTKWSAGAMSEAPGERKFKPFWCVDHKAYAARGGKRKPASLRSAWRQIGAAGQQALGVGRLGTMLLLERVKLTKNAIALPFASSMRTPLTGQVTAGRQFTVVQVPLQRVSTLRKRTRSTLNHVALTCLDGALRSYLHDQGVELKRPITIQMPVNLRREGDREGGNKIGIIQVELSDPTDDPYVRLRNVGFSLRNVRTMIDSVVPAAIESYTVLTGLVAQGAELLQLSNTLPPLGNTLVSNLPGPKKHLYIKGARLEAMCPVSTLPPSNLLNITLFSYAGQLYFGLIATDDLPDLTRLGGYIGQAFGELERAVFEAQTA